MITDASFSGPMIAVAEEEDPKKEILRLRALLGRTHQTVVEQQLKISMLSLELKKLKGETL